MDLLTQTYLRNTSNPIESITERFKIIAKRHNKYPNLVQFKYNQIESPMNEPLVQECRGLILDEADDWNIIAYPFKKFFNYGENYSAEIDWKTARVYEKLDGSLIIMYYYDGAWQVATSGTPDASGPVPFDGAMTFEKLFWDTWHAQGLILPEVTDNNSINECYTFMFELTTPYNRVVVQHKESKVTLIGARDREWHNEFPVDAVGKYFGWPYVQRWALETIDDLIEANKNSNPMDHEGYVVCDANFNRVKVKSPTYVALHHIHDGMSQRRILELIRTNESSEFLTYFPEYTEQYNKILAKYNQLLFLCYLDYQNFKQLETQKEFALAVKDRRHSGILFRMRKDNIDDPRHYVVSLPIKNLESLLDSDYYIPEAIGLCQGD